jgi:hypothetical protein
MRDYRVSQQWPAVADLAVVPYEVFKHRVRDGWDALKAATTPARSYTSIADRVREIVTETPGITTADLAARLGVMPLQVHYAVARECREGRMSRTLVAKGAKGERPTYAVAMAAVVAVAPVVVAPPVVLMRRAPMIDYGSPFARGAA